jgi:hypothetical protein
MGIKEFLIGAMTSAILIKLRLMYSVDIFFLSLGLLFVLYVLDFYSKKQA